MECLRSLPLQGVSNRGTPVYGRLDCNPHRLRGGDHKPAHIPLTCRNEYSAVSRLDGKNSGMEYVADLASESHVWGPRMARIQPGRPYLSTVPRQQRPDKRRMPVTSAAKKTYSSFDEMIAGEEVVLVDFYAVWCGPCQMMNKELEQVALERKGKLKVVKIDTEKYPQLASRYDVSALPTMMLFRNGTPVHKLEGALSAADLMKRIDIVLAIPIS